VFTPIQPSVIRNISALIDKARAIGPITAEASFYHLGEHDTPGNPTRHRSLDTYGGRLLREPAKAHFDGEVEVLHQTGTVHASTSPTAATLPVSAWFVHASAGYTFANSWNMRLSAQYDMASGDKGHGTYGHFDTLFGMRRADLAPSGMYNAVGRANISTPGIRIEIAPSKRWDAFATYHAMWLASRTDSFSSTGVRDATGRSGSFAGHQFDGRFRWWVRPKRLQFEMDGVLLAKGPFLEVAPNATVGKTTAYGSLNLMAMF